MQAWDVIAEPATGSPASPGTPGSVLLISRGTMSGGRMMGECLARSSGLRCVTREDLIASVNRFGDFAARITAQMEHCVSGYERFCELRRPYQVLMRRALLEYAREGGLAYFGYSGHLLLDRVAHFVRIRLIAPAALRIARTCEQLGCSETEARDYIHQVDDERIRWARFMYGVDIRDVSLYDLCLSMDRLSLAGACHLLRGIMQHPDFRPTPESLARVEADYTASQVLAALVLDSRTQKLEIAATLQAGTLRLVGPYLDKPELETVVSVASGVASVGAVEYEPGYAPAYQYSC